MAVAAVPAAVPPATVLSVAALAGTAPPVTAFPMIALEPEGPEASWSAAPVAVPTKLRPGTRELALELR